MHIDMNSYFSNFRFTLLFSALAVSAFSSFESSGKGMDTFTKVTVTDKFWAEGASFADFNRDGNVDIVSGPFWYEGPDFKKRH